MIRLALLCLMLMPAPLQAQAVLPDPASVEAALDGHPTVQKARARLDATRAEARALSAGSQEFVAAGSFGNRQVGRIADFPEYDVSLSREVRLPGKAALDRKTGAAALLAAENMADDARHQAALALSDHWWDWLGAAAERQVLDRAVATLEAAAAAVRRRAALRDAASMDAEQAEAALAAARAAARVAAGKEASARGALAVQFPDLPLPLRAPPMPDPALPDEGLETLGQLVVDRSHEIGAAVAGADMAATRAERTRRNRIADPSIGVRGFSEFGGAERGVGVQMSLPLGGRYRRAVSDQALADAQAADAHSRAVRQDIATIANRDVAMAHAHFTAWESAREAARSSASAAARAERGHVLGGLDLSERLYAQRLADEAALGEAQSRTEAWRAITRLRIDSHTLWMHDD